MGGGGGAALMPPPASLGSRGGGGGALSRGPALLGGGGGRERGIVAVGTFCGALEGGGGGGNLDRSVESDLVVERDLSLPTNYIQIDGCFDQVCRGVVVLHIDVECTLKNHPVT